MAEQQKEEDMNEAPQANSDSMLGEDSLLDFNTMALKTKLISLRHLNLAALNRKGISKQKLRTIRLHLCKLPCRRVLL